jgi:FkbM family methyltransferase
VHDDLVFDVGAHRGEDTDFYLKKGFRVVAVECDPDLVAHLTRRFSPQIQSGSLTLVPKALSENGEQVQFYKNLNKSVWGTTKPEWADRNARLGTKVLEITVESLSPAELFRQYGTPFYLKIDIEGCDVEVLQALREVGDRPAYVSIESEDKVYSKLADEFEILSALGYDRFKIVPQHMVQEQRLPCPSLHGNDIDHTFEAGSSGAFGEEVTGSWLTLDDALQFYRSIFVQYNLEDALNTGLLSGSYKEFLSQYDLPGVWYDTHAKHGSIAP